MIPEGWIPYESRRPPSGILCEFARLVETDQSPGHSQEQGKWVGFAGDLHPQSNICGLYWRLTGIGREYLDSLSPRARMQEDPPQQLMGGQGGGCWNALLGPAAGLGVSSMGGLDQFGSRQGFN